MTAQGPSWSERLAARIARLEADKATLKRQKAEAQESLGYSEKWGDHDRTDPTELGMRLDILDQQHAWDDEQIVLLRTLPRPATLDALAVGHVVTLQIGVRPPDDYLLVGVK